MIANWFSKCQRMLREPDVFDSARVNLLVQPQKKYLVGSSPLFFTGILLKTPCLFIYFVDFSNHPFLVPKAWNPRRYIFTTEYELYLKPKFTHISLENWEDFFYFSLWKNTDGIKAASCRSLIHYLCELNISTHQIPIQFDQLILHL